MSPQVIFGTATFGMDDSNFQDKPSITSLFRTLTVAGVKRLDSGARYPPLNPGRSEQLIGESVESTEQFTIDTKVYADTKTDGSGELTIEAVEASARASLTRLGRTDQGVNVLHIHRADPSTPVREQVLAFNEQIKKGHCKAWGLSNVPIPMVEEMLRVCDDQDLIKPECYQGEYNIITRGAELELLPLLRRHGMRFNAFRPLAAGFVTGNFLRGNHAGTRFGDDNPLGKAVQNLFNAEDLKAAMASFDKAVTAHELTTLEVALRWAAHHSALQDVDGLILGASKQHQVEESTAFIAKGPLPVDVLEEAQKLWEAVAASRKHIL